MKIATIYGGGFAPRLGIGEEGENKGVLFSRSESGWLRIADLNQYAELISAPEKTGEPAEESPKPKKSRRPRNETEGAES